MGELKRKDCTFRANNALLATKSGLFAEECGQ